MFKLTFDIPRIETSISLGDSLLLMGSCFADEIGGLLSDYKFHISRNPFGTLFNPLSIFSCINICLKESAIRPLARRGDLFYSWDTHSALSGPDEDKLQNGLENAFQETGKFLQNTDWVILTLGTAFVYELRSTGEVVANCHKFPQQDFNKRLLIVPEIKEAFDRVITNLKKINPGINVLFTVSPVRHIKDGLVDNNRSKAVLIQAVHEIVAAHQNCHYFPAYEIVMDELRDYRFFKEDMIHPSQEAVRYVWDAFQQACLDEPAQSFCQEWKSVLSALRHQSMHPDSQEHQKFLRATLSRLMQLKNKVDITRELELIKDQINQ